MTTGAYSTSVRIEAPPADVFQYLTDSKLMLEWMGDWADLAPEPGGTFALDINGVPIRGEYVAVEPPHRVVFTWGVPGNDVLMPGSTTVEITLTADGDDTVLELVHSNLPPDEVPRHGDGWSHFLPRLVITAAGGDPGPDSWRTAASDD